MKVIRNTQEKIHQVKFSVQKSQSDQLGAKMMIKRIQRSNIKSYMVYGNNMKYYTVLAA